jgi:hypothetical protein
VQIYTILCKGHEHPWVLKLQKGEVLEPNPCCVCLSPQYLRHFSSPGLGMGGGGAGFYLFTAYILENSCKAQNNGWNVI